MTANALYTDISQLVQMPLREEGNAPISVQQDAYLWVSHGQVVRSGPLRELPTAAVATRISLEGRAVVPGLVDSHTHCVFAGDRMDEMARRARGETYEEIAAAGGGIRRSVAALREASQADVVQAAQRRLRHMLGRGTTTVEIKSGYGLTVELERRHLQMIAAVAQGAPVETRITLLAHGFPAQTAPGAHIDAFCALIAECGRLQTAHHVDAFVEHGVLTPQHARQLAHAAQAAGLKVKLHVDQLRDGDGAALAAELGALSADHLEYTGPGGAAALAKAGTMATLLPGCGLFLGKGPWPNGRALRDSGVEVAVATDCNPGSSMVSDLLLCATLAATRCGLTLEEALWGATRGGAKALDLHDRGGLLHGERADFVVLDHADWRAALYMPGSTPIYAVARAGAWAVAPAV